MLVFPDEDGSNQSGGTHVGRASIRCKEAGSSRDGERFIEGHKLAIIIIEEVIIEIVVVKEVDVTNRGISIVAVEVVVANSVFTTILAFGIAALAAAIRVEFCVLGIEEKR